MTPSAERSVIESIDALRADLVAEKAARRCQMLKLAAMLAVAGLLMTVGAAGTTTVVVKRAAAQDGVVRARANCEAGNVAVQRALAQTRQALNELVDDPERLAGLSPKQRAAVEAQAERSRQIGARTLTPEPRDCAAEFPSP